MSDENKKTLEYSGPFSLKERVLATFAVNKDVWNTATALGIEPGIVRLHLRNAKVKLPKGSWRTRPANKATSSPLSPLHMSIGAKIQYLRFERVMELSEFASSIGLSAKKYGAIERGQYDFTLSELDRVARGLNISVSDVLQPLVLSAENHWNPNHVYTGPEGEKGKAK